MAIRFTRRALMKTAGALTASAGLPALSGRALAQEAESHGLSTFGELALPPDFPHFAYVNPKAPKGGTLTIQIKRAGGNQSFDTFDTLNTFVLRQPDGWLRRRARLALWSTGEKRRGLARQADLSLSNAARGQFP
jgi:microcin C transport system substrate-binding protein